MSDKRKTSGGSPLLRLGLGICPAIAVTTTAVNGLAMGVATACALVCVTLIMSLLGKLLSEGGRLPVTLTVSALFATLAQMVLRAEFPAINVALGVFVPLIAVNCLILCRADAAVERGPGGALVDGLVMGIRYVLALTVLGVIRELIGCGSVFGTRVLPAGYEPVLLAVLPAGGFMLCGLAMGVYRAITGKGKDDGEEASA